jgi:hypothetical protein
MDAHLKHALSLSTGSTDRQPQALARPALRELGGAYNAVLMRRQAAASPALALSAAEVALASAARCRFAVVEQPPKDVERAHHSPPCISSGVQLFDYAPEQPAALIRINLGWK